MRGPPFLDQMHVDPPLAALRYNLSPSPSPSLCAGDKGSIRKTKKETRRERKKAGGMDGRTDEYSDIGLTSSNVFAKQRRRLWLIAV